MKRTIPTIPDAFSWMLLSFNNLIEDNPPIQKVKAPLKKLIDDAKINPELNYRQREAIIACCDNYLNGTYGNTKTAENLNHGKPSALKKAV